MWAGICAAPQRRVRVAISITGAEEIGEGSLQRGQDGWTGDPYPTAQTVQQNPGDGATVSVLLP